MRKLATLAILVFLCACLQTIAHQEVRSVKGNNGTFSFYLDGNASYYDVNLDLYYTVKFEKEARKKVRVELKAPNNSTTKTIYLLSEDSFKEEDWKNVRFIHLKPAPGNYTLSFKKEKGRTSIERARVTVRQPK